MIVDVRIKVKFQFQPSMKELPRSKSKDGGQLITFVAHTSNGALGKLGFCGFVYEPRFFCVAIWVLCWII